MECDHPESEIRKRIIKGGGVQYVNQCLSCGKAVSHAMNKYKAFRLNSGIEPESFDTELLEKTNRETKKYYEDRQAQHDVLKQTQDAEFQRWYSSYLLSEAWGDIRQMVFDRADYRCEGCGYRSAKEVHHLTYRNVGDEFLFQLIALCHGCHSRYHEKD